MCNVAGGKTVLFCKHFFMLFRAQKRCKATIAQTVYNYFKFCNLSGRTAPVMDWMYGCLSPKEGWHGLQQTPDPAQEETGMIDGYR